MKRTLYGELLHYQKVLAVQETFQENWCEGMTKMYVYRKYIEGQYFICYGTFIKYLGVNAKRKIRLINEKSCSE